MLSKASSDEDEENSPSLSPKPKLGSSNLSDPPHPSQIKKVEDPEGDMKPPELAVPKGKPYSIHQKTPSHSKGPLERLQLSSDQNSKIEFLTQKFAEHQHKQEQISQTSLIRNSASQYTISEDIWEIQDFVNANENYNNAQNRYSSLKIQSQSWNDYTAQQLPSTFEATSSKLLPWSAPARDTSDKDEARFRGELYVSY